jgi:TolB protein
MKKILFALLAFWVAGNAGAQITITVEGGALGQRPIAITNFPGGSVLPDNMPAIVRADLGRTGEFAIKDVSTVSPVPTESSQLVFAEWKPRADYLAFGSVKPLSNNQFEASVGVIDLTKQQSLGTHTLRFTADQTRLTAHKIADFIYERITGTKGVATSRIAYVVKTGARYQLMIADADGQSPISALSSSEPIISPAWAPDGNRIAYVSFESKKPVVYVHHVASGQRRAVANFKGSNSAPAWSPNGRELAVVLTQDGNSEIYIIGADGSNPRRLTRNNAIDTEPVFSPDGNSIFFTSDRGGGPQIYRMSAQGESASPAQRVTTRGNYNVTPRMGPDGKLVYVARDSAQRHNVMALDTATGQDQQLTEDGRNESPSVAPNGKMVMYASDAGGKGTLAVTSSDGRTRQRLVTPNAEIREPTWGPAPQ